jgi:hypothetical protein
MIRFNAGMEKFINFWKFEILQILSAADPLSTDEASDRRATNGSPPLRQHAEAQRLSSRLGANGHTAGPERRASKSSVVSHESPAKSSVNQYEPILNP